MEPDDSVFPQQADPSDAVLYAQLIGQDNSLDYVETGLDVTADFSQGDISIEAGVCYLSAEKDEALLGETILSLGYAVQVGAHELNIEYPGDNYVVVGFVDPDLTQRNDVTVAVKSSLSDVDDDELVIANVDNDDNEVELYNREPTASFAEVDIDGSLLVTGDIDVGAVLAGSTLSIPTYSLDADAPQESLYWHTSLEQLHYKDEDGEVHVGSGGGGEIDDDSTFVTLEDEDNLENSARHADLEGDQLHLPLLHGDDNHAYRDRVELGAGHYIEYEDGLVETEIARLNLRSNERFGVDRMMFRIAGGGSSLDAELVLYDESEDEILESVHLGSRTTSRTWSAYGANISLRVTNETGSTIDVMAMVLGRVQLEGQALA